MTEQVDYTDDDQFPVLNGSSKRKGRPRNTNYLSYEEAREFIRSEMLPSRGKFHEWWDRNKPKAIPKFPYRVYTEEWVSWNDFLGTDNKFNEKVGTKWQPLMEAIKFVHTLKLGSQTEWLEWCRIPGNLPKDIPARPDLVYDKWRGWTHWLGNKPVEVLAAKQEALKTQVFYLIHEQNTPQNIILCGVEPGGLPAMKDWWEREQFDIVKLFWYDPAHSNRIKYIVDSLSSMYQDYDKQRLVPNVWELTYHLQMTLELVTREQMIATQSPPKSPMALQPM